eukprot:jgi/Chlat1/166/Chrsp1S03100
MADNDRWSLGLEEATLQKLVEKNGDTASVPTDAPVQAVDGSAAHDGQKKTDGSHDRAKDKDRHQSRDKEPSSRSSKSKEGASDRKSRKEPRDEKAHARSDAHNSGKDEKPARDPREHAERNKADKGREKSSRSSREVSNNKHDGRLESRSDGRDAGKKSEKKREESLPDKEGSAKRARVEDKEQDKDKNRDKDRETEKDRDRDKEKVKDRDGDRNRDRSKDKHDGRDKDNDKDKNKDSRNGPRDDDKINGQRTDRVSHQSSERSKSARHERERERSRSPRKRRRSQSRSPSRRRRSNSPRRRRSRSSSRRHRSRTKSISPPPLNPKYRRFGGGSSGLGGYSPRRRIGGDDRSPTPLPSPERRIQRTRARAWDQAPPGLEGMSATQAVQAAVTTPNMAGVNPMLMMPQLAQQMSAMQAQTRPLRRLYVGNVPTTSNEAELMAFFNTLMTSSRCQHIPGTQPVSSVSLFVDKAYAFLEFLTPEDAAAALNFDGVIYNGSVLKVRRPKDYPALQQTVLGPLLPPAPIVDLLDKDVSDGPNKIFVGGIPHSVDREKVKEIVTAFGQLKGFSMVMDLETGNHQGRAFLEYKDSSVTTRAVAGLNGMALGEGILTVCLATPDVEEPPVDEQGERLNFYGIPEHAKPLMETPQRIIELSNVVTLNDLIEDEAVAAIEEDIRLECARWGTVKSAHIPRPDAESIALELEKRAAREIAEAAASSEAEDQDGQAQLPADFYVPSPPLPPNTQQSNAPVPQEHGDEPAASHGIVVPQDNQPTSEQESMPAQQSHGQAAPPATVVVVKQEEPDPSASEVTQHYNAPALAALPEVTVKQEEVETALHPAAQHTDGNGEGEAEVTQPVVKNAEATEPLLAGVDAAPPQEAGGYQSDAQVLEAGPIEPAVKLENGMSSEGQGELAQGEAQASAQPAAPAVKAENGMLDVEGKVEDVPEEAQASAQPTEMAPAAVNGVQDKKKREPKGLFKVYVEFSRESSAVQAAHVLHGRLYNGRKVSARYFPLRLYQMHFRKGLVATTHEEKQALALAAQARITAHLPDY